MMKIKRLRNGWIRVEGTLDLVTGDLEVRIQGPEETWKKLPTPLRKPPSIRQRLLRNIFFRDVIIPVHNFLHPRRRGLSYEKDIFIRKMKLYCGNLYWLWESWLKVPRDKWPNLIEEAVSALEKKAHKRTPEELKIANKLELTIDQRSKRIKRTDIAKLTAFCAEKYFQRERIRNRFDKWTAHFDTFKRTFITGNNSIAIIKEVRSGQDPDYYLKRYKEYLTSNFKATFETLETPFVAGKDLSSK